MYVLEVEDGGMITGRRAPRSWTPEAERLIGTTYPFPTDVVASCTGQADLFFPENRRPTSDEQRAIDVLCANCPIFHECNAFAETGKEYGIWAGRRHRR